MPSRDTFPTNLAEVDYSPSFGLTSLEKCAWSNVLIGNINLLPFDGPGRGGGGGNQESFIPGGSSPRSNHIHFYVFFLTKKVPLFL